MRQIKMGWECEIMNIDKHNNLPPHRVDQNDEDDGDDDEEAEEVRSEEYKKRAIT